MSSGTTDASPTISNGIHGGVGNLINHVSKDYHQGFKTATEYYKFLQVVESSSDFPLKYTQAFISTTDSHVLDIIGKSRFVAKRIKETIDELIHSWNSNALKEILKVLKHVPFNLQNLIDNDLGLALKSIKKTSITKNDTEVQRESMSLMAIWKEMQNTNINGKRDSPERGTSCTQNEPKRIKLAIQKDPPPKPKAMINSNFLSALGDPKPLTDSKKFKVVRPTPYIDTIATNNETHSPFASPVKPSPPPLSGNAFNRVAVATDPNRRRVTFKDDLCQIKIYQPDPEEWSSFDNAAPEDIENYYPDPRQYPQQQQTFAHYEVPRINWYQPLELSFNSEDNPNLVIPKLIHTPESFQQDDREKKSLAAIYISIQHIPVSPGEPDEMAPLNNDTRVIPLEDVSYNTTSLPPPPPPPSSTGSINPNELFSAATLNAIAAAIKDPSLLQQQKQAVQHPTYQQHIPVHPQRQQTQLNTNYTYQTPPLPVQAPQPDLSNIAVETVLKNNPGIMQSLKQLSFLASGGNNVLNNSMVPTPPSQPNYQQPINYTNDDYNEGGNFNNEIVRKRNRRKNSRGRGGVGRKKARNTCAFFNTPDGCRKGDSCPWAHE